MATHAYIFDQENKVCEIRSRTIPGIDEAVRIENQVGPNKANSDVWGTLAVNLRCMAHEAEQTAEWIDELRNQM